MTKTESILSKGQTLYEDKTHKLLWTKFFGLSILALTSYYVYLKPKKTLIKLNANEKTYLMGVSYYLTKKHGISPRAVLDDTQLFKDFCLAIADRGGQTAKNFFAENSGVKASYYAKQVAPSHKTTKHKYRHLAHK